MLEGWLGGKIERMPVPILKIWREPTNHINDCYFCISNVFHYRKSKDKTSIVYPGIPSSIASVPHSEDLTIPEPPVLESSFSTRISSEEDTDADFDKAGTNKEQHFPSQQEMDDLI